MTGAYAAAGVVECVVRRVDVKIRDSSQAAGAGAVLFSLWHVLTDDVRAMLWFVVVVVAVKIQYGAEGQQMFLWRHVISHVPFALYEVHVVIPSMNVLFFFSKFRNNQ